MLSPVPQLLGRARSDPQRRRRPFSGIRARLGFPSPAEDFEDDRIDLNEMLVRNEPATFFWRAAGWSMRLAGIYDGDVLVVDRSLRAVHGDIVVAIWDGNQPTCKYLRLCGNHAELHSADLETQPIKLDADTSLETYVVTSVIRQLKGGRVRAR